MFGNEAKKFRVLILATAIYLQETSAAVWNPSNTCEMKTFNGKKNRYGIQQCTPGTCPPYNYATPERICKNEPGRVSDCYDVKPFPCPPQPMYLNNPSNTCEKDTIKTKPNQYEIKQCLPGICAPYAYTKPDTICKLIGGEPNTDCYNVDPFPCDTPPPPPGPLPPGDGQGGAGSVEHLAGGGQHGGNAGQGGAATGGAQGGAGGFGGQGGAGGGEGGSGSKQRGSRMGQDGGAGNGNGGTGGGHGNGGNHMTPCEKKRAHVGRRSPIRCKTRPASKKG